MNRRVIHAVGIFFLAWICLISLAHASLLNRQDIDKLLDGQYIVGEVQADLAVYPLFVKNPASPNGKPDLKAYAFETIDFEPIRGYSGKPIDLLVVMDLTGAFLDARLIDHREPFFNNPTGTKRLGDFSAQFIDLSIQHTIKTHDWLTPTTRDNQSADLQGVNHGTVTTKAINRSIVGAALKVAEAKLGADIAHVARRKSSNENVKQVAWDDLLARGMVSVTQITRSQIEKAYVGTSSAGADKLALTKPNEVVLTFHTALVSIPSIGRSLFDSEGWRYLSSSRRTSQALLITESGALTFIEDESLRVPDALPFEIKQKGQVLKVHDLSYDKGLSVPGYPKTTKLHLLIFDKATPLDPKEPFEVIFKLGRRFATNQVLNKAITKEFSLAYDFNGWRTKVYELIDTKWSALDWVQVWQSRWIEISFLLLGLLLLTIGLIAQQTTSISSQRLRIIRTAYLLFTVGFIGWFAQGQLTIVNVTAAVESLTSGGDLTFLLNDPITSILWIFTAVTLLVWGRSTFCGWLCPFGALQELVSMIANAIGLHQRRLRTALDAKLKWIKYGVLSTILASLFVAPSFAEMAVTIEPFETAISFYFLREWPYVLWAVICLGCGVLVYRGYCRYICPLGAALAAVNFLQRWSWIPRRDACGTPCQSCRHRCEYQAISPVGKINYHECFQCLDCVSIYQDQERCLPLIQELKFKRKNDKRFIPIYVSGDL